MVWSVGQVEAGRGRPNGTPINRTQSNRTQPNSTALYRYTVVDNLLITLYPVDNYADISLWIFTVVDNFDWILWITMLSVTV